MNFRSRLGFSLLEVLIVLALIAIIAISALPSYRQPVLKSEQVLAKIALMNLAIAMQEYHFANESYENSSLKILGMNSKIESSNYSLVILNATKDSFQIAAIPGQSEENEHCGAFILDETGRKSISGKSPLDECW